MLLPLSLSLYVYLACPGNDRDIGTTTTAAATLSHSQSRSSLFVLCKVSVFCRFSIAPSPCVSVTLRKSAAQTVIPLFLSPSPSLFFPSPLCLRYVYGIARTKIVLFAPFFFPPSFSPVTLCDYQFKVSGERSTKTLLLSFCLRVWSLLLCFALVLKQSEEFILPRFHLLKSL